MKRATNGIETLRGVLPKEAVGGSAWYGARMTLCAGWYRSP